MSKLVPWSLAYMTWVIGDTGSTIIAKHAGYVELNPLWTIVNDVSLLQAALIVIIAKHVSYGIIVVITDYTTDLPGGSWMHTKIAPYTLFFVGLGLTTSNLALVF